MFWSRRWLILLLLLSPNARADQLRFGFDFENARIVSAAISTGDFKLPADFCTSVDAKALIRKMRMKDCEALLGRYKILRDKPQVVDAAKVLSIELSKPGYGKYAPLAAEVARQLREYVPADFSAQLNVHFIFGSLSDGFAFGDMPLFTHPIADRAPTIYSAPKKLVIERNARRIGGIRTTFESLGWRMLAAPPADEAAYDQIYGIMFYTDFDETAYELGWLMASTIIQQDGKAAIFELLKQPPKQFVLRYQTIAQKQGKLPLFSADFLKQVAALP
jgi:hypothetical protein